MGAVFFVLFYFLPFLARGIYCFLNVKNFKYRKAWRERKQTLMYVLLLSFEKPINNKYYEGGKKPMSSTKQEVWNNKDNPCAERNPKPYSKWKTPCGRGRASSEEPASGWAVATWVMTEGTAWIPGL